MLSEKITVIKGKSVNIIIVNPVLLKSCPDLESLVVIC